jgi:Protein of unknown function (DUF4239)
MSAFGVAGVWLTLVIALVVSIAAGMGSVWLTHRYTPEDDGTGPPPLAPFISTVGIVYGALLGFTVAVAWGQFSSAEVNVANEASTLTTMYRQTVGMPEPQRTEMRELLRKYATTVIGPEWDANNTGGGEGARNAITEMYVVFGRQDPDVASNPVNGQFLGQLTALASDRNQRFLDAKPRMPVMMWVGLLVGAAVLIALMAFIRLPSRRGHMLLSGTVAMLLGLLLFILYWLDYPFGTQLGVTPAPFERAVEVFDAVDRG